MFLARSKVVYLLLVIVSFLLVSTSAFAVDKGDLDPIQKANLQPKRSSPQMEEDDAPAVENMLRAKQAGGLEKADRIQAILNEEAGKFWRSPGGDEIVVESPYPIPPQRDNALHKSYLWDNDNSICFGPVSGGISVDYDTSGNVYAVRCSTWNDSAHACINLYKSTDGGKSWSFLNHFATWPGNYSYPVVLTGSTNSKLYVFYLNSYHNGNIRMASCSDSGEWEGFYDVKADEDTITYFSACVDYENGNHLMVVYQKEEMGDDTPDLYTITSTDYGETWSNEVLVYAYGSHPDIAYGRNGYVYLVFEWPGGGDYEIGFIRSTDYCSSGSWVDLKTLTTNSYDDTYPKVAALHTLPADSPYVWVAYNETSAGTDIDLGYAYSNNGGKDWSENHILDSSTAYNEMACDLWTKRSPDYHYVNVCYFKGRYVQPFPRGAIFYGRASATHPTNWGFLFEISNHRPSQSEDGRKVCQGTYAPGNYGFMGAAIIYAGKDPWDDPFGDNFRNLWFDNSAWPTDVEEEMTEGEVPAEFSLSANYPNPFNPVTKIQYTVGSKQTPEEPVHGSQFTVHGPIHTTLRVYNVLGQLVRTLVNEPREAGTYEVKWDGRDDVGNEVASGIYFYRLSAIGRSAYGGKAGGFVETKKMLLLK